MKTIIFIKHMNLTVVSVGKSVSFSGLTNRLLWRSFERQQWAPVRHQHQHQHQTSNINNNINTDFIELGNYLLASRVGESVVTMGPIQDVRTGDDFLE